MPVPACAKPRKGLFNRFSASAGEGRSEKIMLKEYAKAKMVIEPNPISL
jgi:hypothetical protein